ncbi:MAG: FecR family protein [Terriglobales bacterium]
MSMRRIAVLSTLAVLSCWLAVPSFADSHARIVRLSQVDGDVQIDRNTGQGYEQAFLNLPITQGTKLRTAQDARAEIEFEDGSTLRITPGTSVEFPELARRDSGARASSLELRGGTAYLNFKGDKQEEFTLAFGQDRLALTKPAHLRIELKDADATVAVFQGDVEVASASGRVKVEKKHSATFSLAGTEPYALASNLEPDPYDEWDKQQDKYHQQYSASNGFSPYGYGASDLSYYGSFYNIPGYGMMWQPYLVGAGWDPFMNGAWMWYPGSGYAWVSAYPWGWTPYRYGSWTYLNAYGWFWQPGNSWAGWNTGPNIAHAPQTFSVPRPPATPGRTLLVNRVAPAGPVSVIQNKAEIRGGSAGLGVPRGSVRNLGKISQQMERTSSPGAAGMHASPAASAVRLPPASSRVSSSSPRGGAPMHGGAAARSAAPSSTAAPRMSGGSGSPAPSSHGGTHR